MHRGVCKLVTLLGLDDLGTMSSCFFLIIFHYMHCEALWAGLGFWVRVSFTTSLSRCPVIGPDWVWIGRVESCFINEVISALKFEYTAGRFLCINLYSPELQPKVVFLFLSSIVPRERGKSVMQFRRLL